MQIEFDGGAWWPERRSWALGHPTVNLTSPYAMGATTKRMGVVLPAPRTGTLTGYGVLMSTHSEVGIPPNPTSIYRFSLQGVDAATGAPNGGHQIVHDVAVEHLVEHAWHRAEMAETYDVERGDLVACTLEWAVEGQIASCFWTSVLQPQNEQGPPWSVYWTAANDWALSSGSPYMPCLILLYEDGDTTADGPLPAAILTRCTGTGYSTYGPVGMRFTVPRPLECDAICFHHAPNSGTTLRVYDNDVRIHSAEIAASGAWRDWEVTFGGTFRPGRTYRIELTSTAGPFNVKGYQAVAPPDAEEGVLDGFDGGTTWIGYGDDPPLVDRWFMSLRIARTAASLLSARTGCGAMLSPEPCPPVCPDDPEQPAVRVMPSGFLGPLFLLGLAETAAVLGPALGRPTGCGATFANSNCAVTGCQ